MPIIWIWTIYEALPYKHFLINVTMKIMLRVLVLYFTAARHYWKWTLVITKFIINKSLDISYWTWTSVWCWYACRVNVLCFVTVRLVFMWILLELFQLMDLCWLHAYYSDITWVFMISQITCNWSVFNNLLKNIKYLYYWPFVSWFHQ